MLDTLRSQEQIQADTIRIITDTHDLYLAGDRSAMVDYILNLYAADDESLCETEKDLCEDVMNDSWYEADKNGLGILEFVVDAVDAAHAEQQ